MDLLFRLVIWLVVKGYKAYKKSQAEAAAAAPGPQQGVSAEGTAAPTPLVSDAMLAFASQLDDVAEELASTANGFARSSVDDPARAVLRQVAVDVIEHTAREHRMELRSGNLLPGATERINGSLTFHRRLIGGLESLDAQRSDPGRSGLLTDVDVAAMACYQPLLDFQRRRNIPLATRRTVAFFGESAGSLAPLFARTAVAPIEVSLRLQHDVIGWPLIGREIGRDVVLSTVGLWGELRDAAGFPPPAARINTGFVTQDDVQGALGSWLLELAADGIGTLMMGPSYLAALTVLLRVPDKPFRTRVVTISDGRVSSSPPAELRVQLAAKVLDRIGYSEPASRLLAAWEKVHGGEIEFYFPTGGGRYAAVPEDFYLGPVHDLALAICSQQVPSLAGMHLVDVPGFHFSLGLNKDTEAAHSTLRSGRAATGDPRALVAAAALLGYEEPARRVPTLSLLRSGLAPHTETRQRRTGTASPQENLLSPQVIRDALVLQGVFSPIHR